ncbi:PREDICTED: C-Myc-binding protein-like [Diuraphis noxia]|uniref:C-Myc-binding protein-like n=1 Tax=Diuraphis noxia TaxID=143948 RepID=UPI0007638374|nr:PREDICTED: C-Myc-binding protein-like [Diuraphis noxia]
MNSFPVSEQDKDEFLNYLDQNGILDKLTDVLIMLYSEPEPPIDPIEYVRGNIYVDNPDMEEIVDLKTQIQNAAVELAELRKTRDELRAQLEQHQHESQPDEEHEEELAKGSENGDYVDAIGN